MQIDPHTDSRHIARGMAFAVTAYGLWGILPVYWKFLPGISSSALVAHRIVWAVLVCLIAFGLRGQFADWAVHWRDRTAIRWIGTSAVILGLNWLLFVYAIESSHIVEASLGYFITPLFNVGMGALVLRERLSRLQWVAVGLASIGIFRLLWDGGQIPWISLGLAVSFGLYGLIRKQVRTPALFATALELSLLFPVATIYLMISDDFGFQAMPSWELPRQLLILGTGIITIIPLVSFAAAVQRLPLAVMGFVQFIAPILQLVLATWLYDEPLSDAMKGCFLWIFPAVTVFCVALYQRSRGR